MFDIYRICSFVWESVSLSGSQNQGLRTRSTTWPRLQNNTTRRCSIKSKIRWVQSNASYKSEYPTRLTKNEAPNADYIGGVPLLQPNKSWVKMCTRTLEQHTCQGNHDSWISRKAICCTFSIETFQKQWTTLQLSLTLSTDMKPFIMWAAAKTYFP